MKTREEILARANEITVVNDGSLVLPVLTSDLEDWEHHNGDLSKENVERFWLEVDVIGEDIPNIYTDLVAAGAAVRYSYDETAKPQ